MRIPRLALALLTLVFTAAAADLWQIDASHSSAQFSVRHMMVANVRGEFGKMAGTVQYDPADPAKTVVEATIDAASLNTRSERRDKHLKSADFFDVEKYPAITFKSRSAEPAGPGKMKLVGDLTIHGITKEVTLDVEGPTPAIKDQRGSLHIGAAATAKISRKEFGMTWNNVVEGGGVVVGDAVNINIDIELVQRRPAPTE